MLELIRSLAIANTTKIVLMSLDGLGGLPRPETGKSELETARVPNLTALASEAACGLLRHVAPGITPGSGPGHLGLFGYDPLRLPGRPRRPRSRSASSSICARATWPRAATSAPWTARASSPTGAPGGSRPRRRSRLVDRLKAIRLPGVEVLVEPVQEHRFVLVLRGAGLSGRLTETDPQALGKPPLPVKALEPAAARTAELVNAFVEQARRLLADAAPANMVLLRGFDALPELPRFPEVYGLRAAAIAAYPMYRGLAKLVGMDVHQDRRARSPTRSPRCASTGRPTTSSSSTTRTPTRPARTASSTPRSRRSSASTRFVPAVRALGPDVLVVTGDHATPSILAGHGWQPVPVLVWSRYCGADPVTAVRRARLRRGHAGRAAGPSPDAAGHGQRPAGSRSSAPSRRLMRFLIRLLGALWLATLVVSAAFAWYEVHRGAHAAGRGPPAPGRPRRRRRARGLRAAGGPWGPHRLRARVHALQPARPHHRHLRRLRLGDRRHRVRQASARPDHPARHRRCPAQRAHPRLLQGGRPRGRWCTWCRCSRTSAWSAPPLSCSTPRSSS